MNKSDARTKANQLLEEFGLAAAAKRPLSKFSGGMRRRLDLAASLIAQPPLIFLDEPTTGLDPRTRNQMWDTIRNLVSKGCTILLTTQYLDEADQLADRIAVIDRGKVIAEGTGSELKASIGTATLQLELIKAKDVAEATKISHKVLGVKSSNSNGNLISAPITNPDLVTDLLIALRSSNIHLKQVSVQEPTLDEVFLTLTGKPTIAEKGENK
jgi:ABC-2 type transport system ATP-binding protein